MHDSSPHLRLRLACTIVVERHERHTLISLNGSHTLTPHISIFLNKLREKSARREVARHIHLNQYLPRAAVASTYPDGRYPELLRHETGNFGGHSFHDDGKTSGLLHGESVLKYLQRASGCLSLHPETTDGVVSLGRESDMAEDWNARSGDALNGGSKLDTTLELDALYPTFLDDTDGRLEALFGSYLVGAHGQVANLSKVY